MRTNLVAWATLLGLTVACGSKFGDGDPADPGATDADRQALVNGPSWPQWGQSQDHAGFLPVTGQALNKIYLNYTYDPLVADEVNANEGDLLAHYMTPLTDGDCVYMEEKGGTYRPETYASQSWGISKFKWENGALVKKWTTWTDWKASGSQYDFWEPAFHAALANGALYAPGGKGTIVKIDKQTGAIVQTIDAFNNNNKTMFMASPITVDTSGNLYYTVLDLPGGTISATMSSDESFTSPRSAKNWHAPRISEIYAQDANGSYLVKVSPNGTATKADIKTLVQGAPGKNDDCIGTFDESTLPWPPSPDAVPSTLKCGTQRAAINAAPAVAADGMIYIITRAHMISRYGYLTAVNANLTSKWSASLRDRFHDGCGVLRKDGGQLPPNGAPGGCRANAPYGVDPAVNRPGGGRVLDDASSSPVVAPDGSVYYGAYTRYNFYQGHLMHFSASGQYLNAYEFGWDTTPAIYKHNGTFSVITKDNHYAGQSYCDTDFCPEERPSDNPEQYHVTQLSPDLKIEWSFNAFNTLTCHRDGSGNVQCTDDPAQSMEGIAHPLGFEWCVNAPAVDANGVVYANSEDGWLYAIKQGGTLRDRFFQQNTIGAAYTPASLGTDGKVYSQNSGHLFVIGK